MPLTLNKIEDRKGKLSKSNCMILIKSTSDVINLAFLFLKISFFIAIVSFSSQLAKCAYMRKQKTI
jgi:hypothetical protein